MKLWGFTAQVYRGCGIYIYAHITVEHDQWLFPDGATFRDASYCLN